MNTLRIIELRKQGFTYNQIKNELGVSHPTIAKVLEKNGLYQQQKYTNKVDKIIRDMADLGICARDISNEVNIPYNSVRYYMSRNKIRITRTSENMLKVLKLSENHTVEEIADITGLSKHYIHTVRYRKGINKSAASYRRDRAVKLLNEGKSVDEVAEIIGVLPVTITRYIKNY